VAIPLFILKLPDKDKSAKSDEETVPEVV